MKRFLLRLFGLLPKCPSGHPPYAFTDMDGRHYYAWEDFQQMPPARANEIDDVLLQISAAISGENLDALSDAIIDANQVAMRAKDPKEQGRAMAKVATLATELKMRPKHVVPKTCYFALAAICAVREDEDPYVFTPKIQAEKMAAFELAGRAGHDFFTRGAAFRRWLDVTRTSERSLPELFLSWTYHQLRTDQALTI